MSEVNPGGPESGEEPSELWVAVCETIRHLPQKDTNGLESSLHESVLGSKEKASGACAVLDPRTFQIEFVTRAFQELFNEKLSDDVTSLASLLQPSDMVLDRLINGARWDRFTKLSPQNAQESEPDKVSPRFVTELFMSQGSDGKLCWYLISGFCLTVPGFMTRLILVMSSMENSPPNFLMNVARQLDEASVKAFLNKLHQDVQAEVEFGMNQPLEQVVERVEERCSTFATTITSALEGDHMVPLVGVDAVRAFEQLSGWEAVMGNIEQDLKTAWEVTDDVYRDTRCKGAKSIACAVSDPSGPDCPLVYISPGFEHLTQYNRTFALGRNCRFLQPNTREMNVDFNGEEIRRMKHFCVNMKTGQIINLLLNQAKDGTYFWNLLFMNHIKCKGMTHKNARHYIFGVQTNVIVQKDLLDTFIFDAWASGEGKKNMLALRQRFIGEEYKYSPKETSLKKLADSIISEWAFEVGQSNQSFWEGNSYCPVVGRPAVQEFIGQWPTLLEHAAAGVRSLFEMTDRTFIHMKENDDEAVVCAVADPAYFDCPLVFLSKGFEAMTGYRNEFGLGRNCRFLQPNTGDLNKKINGDELGRMKEFCRKVGTTGLKIINLLLNERKTGERFWNLLHMEHVEVNGKPYILAVQTVMDMPLPSVIKDRETSQSIVEYDTAMLHTFMDELCMFLNQMRVLLRGQDIKSMLEAASYASSSIMNFMKRNCDDFEGDHLVPRLGKREVQYFELDVTWKTLLRKVKSLLVDIWDCSEYNEEEVACAVSDPRGNDCPLVYVSHKFELMTGYPREWVLGRNCRFLQPNDLYRNMDFNEADKLRMRDFCCKPQPEGTRIINLLVNEERSGYPFWNLLVMEHVFVGENNYIFGVQTKIDIETMRLAEIFGLDRDGQNELARLRTLLRSREKNMDKTGMKAMCDNIVRQWVSTFPAHLEMPRFQLTSAASGSVSIPLAGLVLSPEQPLPEMLQAGLEDGVRHFALALNSEQYLEDASHVEQVGRLLSFRLAELLQTMRQKYLHYMRGTMTFTLITRPQYINAFKGISKALTSSGYSVCCWLLDVRAINSDRPFGKGAEAKLKQCWQIMSAARTAGDVKAIGLYGQLGSIMIAMSSLKSFLSTSPVSVLAVDDYPRKEQDQSRLERFRKLYVEEYGTPPLLTYGLYGPNNNLLKSKTLQYHAEEMNMNVCTALLKWAEVQGYGALVSRVRDDDLEFNKKVLPEFHRGFTRNYARAPPAAVCAADLEDAFEEVAEKKEAELVQMIHHARASVTAGTRSSMLKVEHLETPAAKAMHKRNSTSVAVGAVNRRYSNNVYVDSNGDARRNSSNGAAKPSLPSIPSGDGAAKRGSTGSTRKNPNRFASTGGFGDVRRTSAAPTKEELLREYRKGPPQQRDSPPPSGRRTSQERSHPNNSRLTTPSPRPAGEDSRIQSKDLAPESMLSSNSSRKASKDRSENDSVKIVNTQGRRPSVNRCASAYDSDGSNESAPEEPAKTMVCSQPASRMGMRCDSFSDDSDDSLEVQKEAEARRAEAEKERVRQEVERLQAELLAAQSKLAAQEHLQEVVQTISSDQHQRGAASPSQGRRQSDKDRRGAESPTSRNKDRRGAESPTSRRRRSDKRSSSKVVDSDAPPGSARADEIGVDTEGHPQRRSSNRKPSKSDDHHHHHHNHHHEFDGDVDPESQHQRRTSDRKPTRHTDSARAEGCGGDMGPEKQHHRRTSDRKPSRHHTDSARAEECGGEMDPERQHHRRTSDRKSSRRVSSDQYKEEQDAEDPTGDDITGSKVPVQPEGKKPQKQRPFPEAQKAKKLDDSWSTADTLPDARSYSKSKAAAA